MSNPFLWIVGSELDALVDSTTARVGNSSLLTDSSIHSRSHLGWACNAFSIYCICGSQFDHYTAAFPGFHDIKAVHHLNVQSIMGLIPLMA